MLHVCSISQGGQEFDLKNGGMQTEQYPQQTPQKEFCFAEIQGLSTFSETES